MRVSVFLILLLFFSSGTVYAVMEDDSAPSQYITEKWILHNQIITPGAIGVRDSGKRPLHRENELLVKFKQGISINSMETINQRHDSKNIHEFKSLGLHHIKISHGLSVQEAIDLYKAEPAVEYVEPNYIVYVEKTPNDTYFNSQWSFYNTGQTGGTSGADIGAPEAWDITTGSNNVVVAVIDTGVDYTHPDLAANIYDVHGWDFSTCDQTDTKTWACLVPKLPDSDPMDNHGHGTHVAGIIGAAGNNNLGVVGVNWNVKIVACKFIGADGYGDISGAINCLQYIKTLKDSGVNIVATNNSWGGGGYSQALYDAINAQAGILFIAAAGNDSRSNNIYPFYPGSYNLPNIISVAATTLIDGIAPFSNYGRRSVHVGAPGYQIWSTLSHQNTWNIPGGYAFLSGTSMAAPHVAGVAALVKAYDAGADCKAIRNLILAGGDAVTSLDGITITGKRLSAYGSLTCDNKPVFSALKPSSVSIGVPVALSAISINCALPVGTVTVTTGAGATIILHDDGIVPDVVEDDGIFTGRWIPTRLAERLDFTFYSQFGTKTETVFTSNPPLSMDFEKLNCNFNLPYDHSLTVKGGLSPYSCSIVSGNLPPGITLSASTCKLSGAASAPGVFTFTAQVSDSLGEVVDKTFSMRVIDDSLPEKWRAVHDTGTGSIISILMGIAVDGSNNVYVSGDSFPVTNGKQRLVTVKYDASGNALWEKTYMEGDSSSASDVAVDQYNNAYVVGNSSTGNINHWIVIKYGPTGDIIWKSDIGGQAKAVALDKSGNIYVVGRSSGYSLIKYDPNGNIIWIKEYGDSVHTELPFGGLTVDGDGNIVVSGYSYAGTAFKQFIVKYDPSGNILWVNESDFGYESPCCGHSIASDSSGNIYAIRQPLNAPDFHILLMKFDPSGTLLWTVPYYGYEGISIAVDKSDYIYVTGSGYILDQGTQKNCYVTVKYDPAGNVIWTRTSDSSFSYKPYGIATGGKGSVYIIGHANKSLDWLTIKYEDPSALTFVAINSGGSAASQSGINYEADTSYSGGYTASTSAAISGTSDDTLYQSVRYGNFSYNIPLANGSYTVRLKFAEIYWDAPGRRVFNVAMQGNQIISNLDIYAMVGKNAAYDVDVPVSVVNGMLNITFSSVVNYAKVSAIVIYQAATVCTANAPSVSITPASQSISTGGSDTYSISITNNDSGTGCTSTTFSLSASDTNSTNFNASTVSPASVTLSPGVSGTATLIVTAKTAQTSGTDSTSVTATASGHSSSVSNAVTTTIIASTVIALAINAGGGQYTDPSGNMYQADRYYSGGHYASTTSAISGTSDDVIYQSERFGNISYNIPLSNGNYTVALKFAETYWDVPGRRVFNVSMQGNQVISNLDIFSKVGKNAAYDVSIPASVTDETLNIVFSSIADYAQVNAIVIRSGGVSQPTIELNPTSLNFTVLHGNNPANQTIALSNSGGGTLNWSIATGSDAPGWLSVSPTRGSGDATLTVSANSANFAPGTYTGKIMIADGNATNTPQTVNATLTVNPASTPPTIDVNPTRLNFTVVQGNNPANQTITLSNSGGGTLNWSIATGSDAPGWLSVSPTRGSGDATLTVSANSANFAPGTYTGKIMIADGNATNTPQTVNATLIVNYAGVNTYISDLLWVGSSVNGWGPIEKDMSNGEQASGDGQIITLNGVTYATGLGVHANSVVTYNLGGQYSRFVSDIGVDDEVGSAGSIVFQVWADGLKIYDSGIMTGASDTKHVDVAVTGKSQLQLKVNAGTTNSGHGDWAGAYLVSSNQVTCSSGDTSCLIDAINQANSEPGDHTINLASGTYTLSSINNTTDGSNGLPSITGSVKIIGAGMDETIIERDDAASSFRIIHIAATGKLTLDGLTITKGSQTESLGPMSEVSKGGGGIYNRGTLDVITCRITDNVDWYGESGRGGGIYSDSPYTMAVKNSIMSYNRVGGGGYGGAIASDLSTGALIIENSTFLSNEAGFQSFGGALRFSGNTTISNSSFISNYADVGGAISASQDISITNSTFYGNFAMEGGAISNHGNMSITNSTIFGNRSTVTHSGGIINKYNPGIVTLKNSILAGNTNNDGKDCEGSIQSLGNNLIGPTTGCSITLMPTDKTGDPKFGAFTDSGLPGNGHISLLSDSPAIDAGDNTACQSIEADQIGNPRIVDGNGDGSAVCDMGAIEFKPQTKVIVFATNSGGGPYTDSSGISYQADTGYSGGRFASTTDNISGTSDGTVYQSVRFGNFSYNIPLKNGIYSVKLKFAEIYWNEAGKRVFNVSMQGTQVITDLDIFSKVGKNAAYDVTIPATVSNGWLNINFTSIVDYAKVSAIEISPN